MVMKLLLLALATTLYAAPALFPDGVPVDPTDPHIGAHAYAIPGSTWLIGGEDCPPTQTCGLNDWNDAMMAIAFDGLTGKAVYLGGNSYWQNYFTVEGVPVLSEITFQAVLGQQLAITLVTGYGATYDSGAPNIWIRGAGYGNPGDVPEPGTWVLVGIGLLVAGRRR